MNKRVLIGAVAIIFLLLIIVLIVSFSGKKNSTNYYNNQMDVAYIQTLNSNIRSYTGKRERGSRVKELLEIVQSVNVTNYLSSKIQVEYELVDKYKNEIEDNKYYTVQAFDELPKGNVDGIYDRIMIKENS